MVLYIPIPYPMAHSAEPPPCLETFRFRVCVFALFSGVVFFWIEFVLGSISSFCGSVLFILCILAKVFWTQFLINYVFVFTSFVSFLVPNLGGTPPSGTTFWGPGRLWDSRGGPGWIFRRFLMDFGLQFEVPGRSFSVLFEHYFLCVFQDASGSAFWSILLHLGSHFGVIFVTFRRPWDLWFLLPLQCENVVFVFEGPRWPVSAPF